MKEWREDHPKAKAMVRRRASILVAAKQAFLKTGYAGTSMEAIAQRADISLMTLYRHAESKDDLFAAVITGACSSDSEEERRQLAGAMELPLEEILVLAAVHIQEILMRADTIALLRLVIAEVQAFPYLAELAYQGFVTHFEDFTAWIINEKMRTDVADPERITAASRIFVDRAVGGDVLRGLLGQSGPTTIEKQRRAELARDDVLKALAVPS